MPKVRSLAMHRNIFYCFSNPKTDILNEKWRRQSIGSNLQALANSLTNIPDISDIFDVRRTRKQQARGVSAVTQSPKTSVSLINLGQKVLTGQYVFFNSHV